MKAQRSLIIIHRHGHRSPVKNIFPGVEARHENDFWAIQSYYSPNYEEMLSNILVMFYTFPSQSHWPFGVLTNKGIDHMMGTGASIAKQFGVTSRDVTNVYSTNYRRTQDSARLLLIGAAVGQESLPTVNVREEATCSLSFYEGRQILAQKMTLEVQRMKSFVEFENLPLFLKTQHSMVARFPALQSASKHFNWLAAFDYYCCRKGNDLPIDPSMAPFEEATRMMLPKRYNFYFRHSKHLALFIVPLLVDILREVLLRGSKDLESSIFSAHDINLLGLFYALGYSRIDEKLFWPDYGCRVVFDIESKVPLSNSFSGDVNEFKNSLRNINTCDFQSLQILFQSSSFRSLLSSSFFDGFQLKAFVDQDSWSIKTLKGDHIGTLDDARFVDQQFYSSSSTSEMKSVTTLRAIVDTILTLLPEAN